MLSRLLEVVAGDTLSFRIVLRDGSSPVDASPMEFSGGVRIQGTSRNIADFSFEVMGGPIGVVRVTLAPEQTRLLTDTSRMYEWHVRMTHGDYVKTLGYGGLKAVRL